MKVHQLLAQLPDVFREDESVIHVTGWMVIIESKLFLLDENLRDPYTDTVKIEISNSDIVFAVRECISPLGGGESFVFHRSIVEGILHTTAPVSLRVEKLVIEEDNASNSFREVNLNPVVIESAKEKYGRFLLNPKINHSGDWLDLV